MYYKIYANVISAMVLHVHRVLSTTPVVKDGYEFVREGYEFVTESEVCRAGERALVLAGNKAVVLYKESIKPGIEDFCVSASDFNVNVVTPALTPMLDIITEFAEDVASEGRRSEGRLERSDSNAPLNFTANNLLLAPRLPSSQRRLSSSLPFAGGMQSL